MVAESDKIGEPKVSAGKMDEPNYLGEAGNKSHGDGNYELFSATGKESCSSVQMDADLIHWLSEDTVIYLFQSTEMASKNPHVK